MCGVIDNLKSLANIADHVGPVNPNWGRLENIRYFLDREVRYLVNPLNIGTVVCAVALVIIVVVTPIIVSATTTPVLLPLSILLVFPFLAGMSLFFLFARIHEQSMELHAHVDKILDAESRNDVATQQKGIDYISHNRYTSFHADSLKEIALSIGNFKGIAGKKVFSCSFAMLDGSTKSPPSPQDYFWPSTQRVRDYVDALYR